MTTRHFIHVQAEKNLDKATGLPPHLLQQLSRRLGMVSLLFIFIWVLYIFHYLTFCATLRLSPGITKTRYAIAFAFISISAVIYLVSRSQKISAKRLIDIGLAYEVIGALGMVLSDYIVPYNLHHISRGEASLVCMWIVLFPLVVPCSPKKALAASFLTATMAPLGMGITVLFGNPVPPAAVIGNMFLCHYVAVVLAFIPARTLHSLGNEIIKEREMGSYKLLELLGRGNMGEVWRAEHRMMRRPAAIKLIRPESVGVEEESKCDKLLQRFEREAQSTASLHSPHSIDLYDFGISDDGTFFYVMELLDGFDLEELVDKWGPLPPERAVYILLQICDSLIDAHINGLIHRDVKPANIFICHYGHKFDFAKVLDFGMVKHMDEESREQAHLTDPGTITGTPAFMAPEVILLKNIDERVDIYALGCVAYWLLSGHYLFDEPTVINTLLAHAQKPPVPLSERTNNEIPEDLEKIVMGCLEKDPDKRPRTVQKLMRSLEDLQIESEWNQLNARRWWGTHVENH